MKYLYKVLMKQQYDGAGIKREYIEVWESTIEDACKHGLMVMVIKAEQPTLGL